MRHADVPARGVALGGAAVLALCCAVPVLVTAGAGALVWLIGGGMVAAALGNVMLAAARRSRRITRMTASDGT